MGLFFFRAEGTLTFSAHPATATISESARNIWSPRYRVNRLIEIAKSCRCSYRGEAKSLRRGVARLNCAPEMRKRHWTAWGRRSARS